MAGAGGVVEGLQTRIPISDLEYLKTLATTILALILLPLALIALFRRPLDVADEALRSHGVA
jgi:hypothetical protein